MNHSDAIARVGTEATNPWMLTRSGLKLYFLDPRQEAITLSDICHHLGNLCRFTGAVSQFYSVAQHSVHVGQLVKNQLDEEGVDRNVDYWDQILAALLHDAEEAYVNDLSSPLKVAIRGKYQWVANAIRHTIYDCFGIDHGYHNQIVKDADNIAILIERYFFMPQHPDWPGANEAEMRQWPCPEFRDPRQAAEDMMMAVHYTLGQRNALLAEMGSQAL